MKEKKPLPPDRSPWTYLGADIETLIEAHKGGDVTSSQIVALMTVAIEPGTLQIAMEDKQARPLANAYAAAIHTNPDLAEKISALVSSKWHNSNPSHSDLVWKFIATNSWAPRVKDNGKVRLEILTKVFSDVELSRAIYLWCGTKIEPASIKEFRKRMPLPKQPLLKITPELNAAIARLRKLGFCQHW